jgi:inosine-uridine nucleoside N-ribohydrolase
MAQRLEDGPAVTLIVLGPPTNIARLFRDHPGSMKSVERVVIMGGALDVPGNVTDYAEFNVWSDPEATALVFSSGVPVTMVGSDVCNEVRTYADKTPVPVNPVIRRLTEAQYTARPSRRITLYDPLTVMAVARPGIVEMERLSIAVDVSDGPERGRTRVDPAGAMIDVAMGVDVDAAIGLFTERVIQGHF